MDMDNLIFIYGSSRSGTTLLSKTLGLHSSIHQFEELHYFDLLRREQVPNEDIAQNLIKRLIAIECFEGFFEDVDYVKVDVEFKRFAASLPTTWHNLSYDDLFKLFITWTINNKGKTVGVEQTGLNLLYDVQVRNVFRHRKAVGIVRSPYAVLSSQKNRWKIGRNGKRKIPRIELFKVFLKYNPWLMARLWVVYNRELLNHDSKNNFLLRYEDLVSNPEKSLRDLMSFLDLTFEKSQLEVTNSGSSVELESNVKGFDQKRIAVKNELNMAEKLIVNIFCGNIMRELGYDVHRISALKAFPVAALYFLILVIQLPLITLFNFNNLRDLIRKTFKN